MSNSHWETIEWHAIFSENTHMNSFRLVFDSFFFLSLALSLFSSHLLTLFLLEMMMRLNLPKKSQLFIRWYNALPPVIIILIIIVIVMVACCRHYYLCICVGWVPAGFICLNSKMSYHSLSCLFVCFYRIYMRCVSVVVCNPYLKYKS